MTKFQKHLPTEPIKLVRRKKKISNPSSNGRKVDSPEQATHPTKERKSGTKKKENNILINNIYIEEPFTSRSLRSLLAKGPSLTVFSEPQKKTGLKVLKRRKKPVKQEESAPHLPEPAKAGKKDIEPKLSKVQKRTRLKYQETYNHPQKNKKLAPCDARITKAMEEIFKAWDDLAFETSHLVTIQDKKRSTKKFKETCSLVRSFLNGKLTDHKQVVVPKYFKIGPVQKKTVEDFKEHLHWLKLQLLDKNYKPLNFKNKIDLNFFLAGTMYTKFPSILLAFCWVAPKSQQVLKHSNDLQFITEPWKLITGNGEFSSRELEDFDTYLDWALPHFKRLHKNLDSLKNFDDEVDVMSFLTFGVLRQMKEKGKSFSSGILNQDFFRTMMEELRKKHGYTV